MSQFEGIEFAEPIKKKFQHNWFLGISLFLLTLISTTFMGTLWVGNLKPSVNLKELIIQLTSFETILRGLKFSVPLLFILLAHELGHYLACRKYRVDATLPFFIPAPIGVGTLGAFIKIKEPFPSKRVLFDVGVAGPISGFLASLPFAIYGIWTTKIVHFVPQEGDIILQDPLLFKILTYLRFGGIPTETMVLNPFIFASWIGLLATMLNLLPFGQLDGGHILYALFGKFQRRLVFPLFALLLLMSIYWLGWLFWAAIIIIISPFHPPLWDENLAIDRKRKIIGIFVLIIFILSFMPVPVKVF